MQRRTERAPPSVSSGPAHGRGTGAVPVAPLGVAPLSGVRVAMYWGEAVETSLVARLRGTAPEEAGRVAGDTARYRTETETQYSFAALEPRPANRRAHVE